jgi:uncharacterized protein YabE (DUF348 family)
MLRKYTPYAAAALLALLALAAIFIRPVTVTVDGKSITLRAAGLTVGQALYASGLRLAEPDRVEPGLSDLIPLDGQIRITRAVQITLWEDGSTRHITGFENTPAALLRSAGIVLNPQDQLTWNGRPLEPNTALPAGKPITLALRRARVVIIDRDGRRERVDSSALTAAGALWQAGVRLGPGDALSVPANTPLAGQTEAGPLVLAHRSAQPVVIEAGGQRIHTHTTAATVGQALAGAGVALQGLDYAEPAEDEPLPEDGQVRVVRVREEIALAEELIPFESKRVPDAETELDQTRVLQAGQYGVKVTRERVRFENEEEVHRAVDSDWTASEPTEQLVGVGSKIVTKGLDVAGGKIEYWRAINVYATSYSPCRLGLGDDRCNYNTSSGVRLRKGIIAVTLAWYRQIKGMQVYVPGYGTGIIGDVGGGIDGTPWIDLGFDESDYEPIVGWTTMYFLNPAPENAAGLVLP